MSFLIWLFTAGWGGIGAAFFFFSWENSRLRGFRVKCTRKHFPWMSDLEVRRHTDNDHWLCTCHMPSYSIPTWEVCRSSFIDGDKWRCQGGKESEKRWQDWGFDTGLTDSTAWGAPLTMNCLQKIRMFQFSLLSKIPLWPWLTRAEGRPRNPTSGSASNCSPCTAAASQWLLWAALWDSACSQKTSSQVIHPPTPLLPGRQNQHTLSFEHQALFRVLQPAASLSTPSLTVRAPDWGWACSVLNVTLCLRSPGLALAAGKPEQQWWIRVFIFEVFLQAASSSALK